MGSITPYGKKWEWSRSIWLVWLLFPFGFFSFISFFLIGARTRTLKWIVAGVIYCLIVVQFFVVMEVVPEEHFFYDISVGLVLAGWIAAWVHATVARVEYLRKIAYETAPKRMDKFLSRAARTTVSKPAPAKPLKMKREKSASKQKNPKVININKAKEKDLRELPSVGPFLAKEIIRVRKRVFAYDSYSHLIACLKVKPHVLAKAKDFIVYSDEELKARKRTESEKQKEDASPPQKRTGRVVDY